MFGELVVYEKTSAKQKCDTALPIPLIINNGRTGNLLINTQPTPVMNTRTTSTSIVEVY